VINKNQATLSLDPTTPITIGSQTFQASDITPSWTMTPIKDTTAVSAPSIIGGGLLVAT